MANSKKLKRVAKQSRDLQPATHLVVCRESSAFDYVLFEGMIDQTLRALTHLPGVREILEAGLDPLKNPQLYGGVRLSRDGTQAVHFQNEGVHYLYSLGSAAKSIKDREENAFVEILCDLATAVQPSDVHVATFSRLLRSTLWAGRLESTFRRFVRSVHCGPTVIELGTPSGKVIWQTLAMVADMERDMIVSRLFAGFVFKHRQGKWILSPEAIPPGWQLEDGFVELDDAAIDATRMLLAMMADESLDARTIVDEAGALGLTSETIRRVHGDDATMADLRRPDSRIRSLIDWVPTYMTGRVGVIWPTPYKGATRFGNLPVYQSEDGDEYVEFTYDWPLPDDGFGPPEVLAAAGSRKPGLKSQRSKRGPSKRGKKRKPLAGWPRWAQGRHAFKIESSQSLYRVVRQHLPKKDDGE